MHTNIIISFILLILLSTASNFNFISFAQRQLQPSDFPNRSQYLAYNVIQRFKRTITCDPKKITSTWTGPRPCNYIGFACDTPPGLKATPKIASVDFNQFRLCAPTISGFIDQLPDLAIFHANSNFFAGSVPNLNNLTFLYELDLSNNLLSGPFPASLLSLNQLIFLDVRFNRFSGSVPASIFKSGLDVLFLNNNGFSEPLPSDLGSVSYLTLANNGFTGPIPASISNSSLIEILFLSNRLSGCLPYQIGLMKNSTVFDAGYNRLTGPIPLSFGCLTNVEQLNLAGNRLYGVVPDVVCDLARHGKLTNLSLSENYFTAVDFDCWELIENKVLDVRKNCIDGLDDQRTSWECAVFYSEAVDCPFEDYIPCELLGPYSSGDRNVSWLEKKPVGPRSGSVTYNAVHNLNG